MARKCNHRCFYVPCFRRYTNKITIHHVNFCSTSGAQLEGVGSRQLPFYGRSYLPEPRRSSYLKMIKIAPDTAIRPLPFEIPGYALPRYQVRRRATLHYIHCIHINRIRVHSVTYRSTCGRCKQSCKQSTTRETSSSSHKLI